MTTALAQVGTSPSGHASRMTPSTRWRIVEDELRAVFASSGLQLNGPEDYSAIGDLVGWPNWESRLRHYLRAGLRRDEGVVDSVIAQIGERRQAESRIKRFGATDRGAPTLACGALDVEEVSIAVQQVMEGSREAFESRREKYGY